MRVNRRNLLKSTAAFGAALAIGDGPTLAFWHGTATPSSSGWQRLGIGDGGYVVGGGVSPSGMATGAWCKTDVAGAYVWNNASSIWDQVCNNISLGNVTQSPGANGCWDICGAADMSRLYMVYGDTSGVLGAYAIWVSTNQGISWIKTVTFQAQFSYWYTVSYDLPNGGIFRLSNQKIVVDPGNPLVAYVGLPAGVLLTGSWSAMTPGVMRTVDGGSTWTAVSGLPAAVQQPGYAGMVIDGSSSLTTLSGQTVHSRVIIPCGGVGVFESTDGGNTFTQVTSDATPSTTLSITTTQPDDVIVLQISTYGTNSVKSVTDNIGLTWAQRATPTPNTYGYGQLTTWWAHAPTAGTYNISVNYNDGQIAWQVASSVDATCTAATCATAAGVTTLFCPLASTTGAFAVGQVITSGVSASGTIRIKSQTDSEHWVLEAAVNHFSTPTTVTAKMPLSNQVVAFAVSGANTTTPFDSGGPVIQFQDQGGRGSMTTHETSLIFSVAFSSSTGNDSGYTLLHSDATFQMWSEISSTAKVAGSYTIPSTGAMSGAPPYITDAINQAVSGSIALDGSAVYASSLPAPGVQPVNITTAQIDPSGTYWAVNGPQSRSFGGVWRYLSGTWGRLDGNNDRLTAPGGFDYLPFGTPGAGSNGNCVCTDPSTAGSVSFGGPWGPYRGFQTTVGNNSLTSVDWTGTTGGSATTTTSSTVGWLAGSTTGGGGALGDMVKDSATGNFLIFDGGGVKTFPSSFHYGSSNTGVNISEGIEETLIPIVLTPPGAPYPIIGLEDERVLLANPGGYPTTTLLGGDSNCWSMDYAADNAAYVAAYVTGIVTAQVSSWSNNFGAAGSWTAFNTGTIPSHSALNGNIACASVGADGLSPTNATACLCLIPQWQSSTNVYYTQNNGGSWSVSAFSGLTVPKVFCGSYNTTSYLLVADKPGTGSPNGIYYLFVPDTGMFKSTDYGANFSKISSFTFGGANTAYGFNLQSVEGKTGHLFLSGGIYSLTPFNLYYCTDGGVTMTQVSGVTCYGYALGKAKAGNSYAVSLLMYGIVSAIDPVNPAMYIGDCNGTDPSAGFTWTNVGTLLPTNTIFPAAAVTKSFTTPTSSKNTSIINMWGDLNLYGRIFIPGSQNGLIMRQP